MSPAALLEWTTARTLDRPCRQRIGVGVRAICRMMVLAGILASAHPGPAAAQDFISELRLGVLAQDIPILAGQKEHGADLNAELLFVSPTPEAWVSDVAPALRWMITPRPNIGIDANTSGYTSQAYLGLVWTAVLFQELFKPDDAVFLNIGFGPAINNGHTSSSSPDHKSLGSNVLFHPSLEVGYRINRHCDIGLYFEHSSNAGLAQHNEGLDNAGVRFGIRF
jgi:lipid A 3-O-deacylase